jgi:hypothetical protein
LYNWRWEEIGNEQLLQGVACAFLFVLAGCHDIASEDAPHLSSYSNADVTSLVRKWGYNAPSPAVAWQDPSGETVYVTHLANEPQQVYWVFSKGSTEPQIIRASGADRFPWFDEDGKIVAWTGAHRRKFTLADGHVVDFSQVGQVIPQQGGSHFLLQDQTTGQISLRQLQETDTPLFSYTPNNLRADSFAVKSDRIYIFGTDWQDTFLSKIDRDSRVFGPVRIFRCHIFSKGPIGYEKVADLTVPGFFLQMDPWSDNILVSKPTLIGGPRLQLFNLVTGKTRDLGWPPPAHTFFLADGWFRNLVRKG